MGGCWQRWGTDNGSNEIITMKNPGYTVPESQGAAPKRYSNNVKITNNREPNNNAQSAVSINVKYKPPSAIKN